MGSWNVPKQPGERKQVPPATQTTQPVGAEPLPPTTLEAALQELGEALERETATSEILQAISMSPTDIRPVLEAIVENARRFCAAEDALVMLPDGDHMRLAAHRGPVPVASDLRYPNDGTSVSSGAFLEARTIVVQDLQTSTEFPLGAQNARSEGYHASLVAPLLREGVAVGTIALRRFDTRQFTRRQIELLETFAAQAAIAIENVRLFNATNEALAQQTAVAEVLKTISRSALDLQSVLDTVVENAAQLCDADAAWVTSPSVERRLMAFSSGVPLERRRAALETRPPTSRTLGVMQQVYATGKTSHIADIETDPELNAAAYVVRGMGGRTVLAVPVLREGHPIAGIVLTRTQVRPFSDREVELAETFASQAGIAIENVRLFNETKEALEQQTATSEVLKAISDSGFDLQPMFDQMLSKAVQLCRADFGALYHLSREGEVLATVNIPSELLVQNREATRRTASEGPNRKLLGGRVRLEQATVHIPDISLDRELERRPGDAYEQLSVRAILGVPMHRAGEIQGILTLWKTEPGPFSESAIALVEAFADQAVIAIENVRLFNETKEALEQQTATSEVLKVIAASPSDIAPVLNAIAESAARFCAAENAMVAIQDEDGLLHPRAHVGPISTDVPPWAVDGTSVSGRSIVEGRTIQVADLQASGDEYPLGSAQAKEFGFHTILAAPMIRDGRGIGALLLRRSEVRPFSDKQVELVGIFADQAVIAIENVRLITEIQTKSGQLEAASRHKSEFLANMSHELRTPLNAIIGFSEVLEQRMFGELNERQAEYTHDIATSGRHLLNLVNEILDLAKVEAGRMELEPSAFAPAETIRGALGFVRERAAEHRITLEADLPENLGILVADERKVRQILLNLLSNAVKFTPDGGRVTLRAQQRGGELEIAVQDTGIGIASADLPRVFEEFQQVGPTTERSREGTGLGLTLAKRFVELHGGRLWVESEVGTGTTFTFAIPMDRAAAAR